MSIYFLLPVLIAGVIVYKTRKDKNGPEDILSDLVLYSILFLVLSVMLGMVISTKTLETKETVIFKQDPISIEMVITDINDSCEVKIVSEDVTHPYVEYIRKENIIPEGYSFWYLPKIFSGQTHYYKVTVPTKKGV